MTSLLSLEAKMKLLEGVIVKAVETSRLMKDVIKSVADLATGAETLAKNLAIMAHNQHVHHQMIGQMYVIQQGILKKMHENAVNLALPVPGRDGKKDVDKPN